MPEITNVRLKMPGSAILVALSRLLIFLRKSGGFVSGQRQFSAYKLRAEIPVIR